MRFSSEQDAFRKSVAAFVADCCDPSQVNEWDAAGEYPAEVFAKMSALGWTGIPFPSAVGGADGDLVDLCILCEELSRASYDLATGLAVSMFCGLSVLRFGTPEQIERHLVPTLAGERRFGIGITEPQSGSDASSIRMRAERVEDGWRLNGQKVFQTGAHVPNTTMLVVARAGEGRDSICMFLVPNSTPGLTIRRIPTMGRTIVGTNEVFYDDVFIPDDHLLGEVGDGWTIVKSGLLAERLVVSACYAGQGQALLDEALRYAKERVQFGQPIGQFQVIAHMLADMQTSVDATRLMVYHAADVLMSGQDASRAVAEAKLFGSEAVLKISGDAMQIFGGYGYVVEATVQRHFRDARAATITAGTSQMQRTIIARDLGLKGATRGS